MTFRHSGVGIALAATALAAGCGGGDDKGKPAESATPQQALAKVADTRSALDQALVTLRSGDRQAAERQVGDAYLKHYEEVEGPLGKVDEALNEKLEEALSRELRDKIRSGAKRAEIEALAAQIRADLDEAERKLR